MLCEYAHAMENSLGNFQEYIDAFEAHAHLCGGFIWDFVDQALRVYENGEARWLYGSDFEKREPRSKKYNRINVTATSGSNTYFCANGIIAADRTPHPSLSEVKKVYAPVKITADSAEDGAFRIKNKQMFTDLSAYDISYEITADGAAVAEGSLPALNAAPNSETAFRIPYDVTFDQAKEYFVTFSVRLREAQPWAEKGYEVTFDQFLLQTPQPHHNAVIGRLTAEQSGNTVMVRGAGFSATVQNGCLLSLQYGGKNVLESPLRPNYFRALTDNDIGALNFVPALIHALPVYRLAAATEKARGKAQTLTKEPDGSVTVTTPFAVPLFSDVTVVYRFTADGKVTVTHTGKAKAMDLLRFGMTFALSGEMRNAQYYGRGPQENYCDRNTGARIALHESPVRALEHRYMRPQENGCRTDVRFLCLTDENGNGLRISGRTPFSFNAWNYTQKALEEAQHLHELRYENLVTVNIDAAQCGVGGDMPGMACLHEPYILHKGTVFTQIFTIEKI